MSINPLPACISRIVMYCLLCVFLSSHGDQKDAPVKRELPDQKALEFADDMKTYFLETERKEGKEKSETVRQAHRDLMAKYPVFYDWWLQDGGDQVNWFEGTFEDQLAQRIAVHANRGDTAASTTGGENKMAQYLAHCLQRRLERLARLESTTPEIVFTKFKILRPSFFAYTEGLSDARHECNFFPGGELVKLSLDQGLGKETVLIKDKDGVIRDPDVHFDGEHLLFSWKKSGKEDDFHLYEMNVTSKKVKQLTSGKGYADYEGIYLPDGNIMFNSTRCGTSVDCWYTEVSNLFLCDREGRFMRQIGFDQVHTPYPTLMEDGRVIYTRWDYNDRGQVFTQPLFQMNADGTGQAEYYGINSWFPTTISHARQIPGTNKVMATFNGHHTPQHGKLGIIDVEAGRDENEGIVFLPGQYKPKAERIDAYGQTGDQYQYPFPLTENEFLISYTPLGYHVGHPMKFGIYWMNLDGERELLAYDGNISCNQPVVLSPRKKPFPRISSVDYSKNDGQYYLQDIYEGPGLAGIKRGEVEKLRIVELEFRAAGIGSTSNVGKGGSSQCSSPIGVGNSSWDVKKVHGEVTVYADGSAFFRVPARTPLYFQALDKDGYVIQTMRSWSTLQPGEFQSCVGCHEHKNTVPANNHPTSLAMKNGVQDIIPVANGVRGFSFNREIQPILDKHCISCHDGKKQKPSLTGNKIHVDRTKRHFNESYLNLTHASEETQWRGKDDHPDVNWISSMSEPNRLPPRSAGAVKSNLLKRLKEGHGKTEITKEEIATLALWIDLLVPYAGDYKEDNAWNEAESKTYLYYEEKREKARQADALNRQEYVKHT